MKTPYELFADEGILASGWGSFVKPLVDECKEKGYEITQIKEKFGTLRFYVGAVPDEFYDKIDEAERLSSITCYDCGKPGKTYYIGWNLTLCPEHAVEHYGEEKVKAYNLRKKEELFD